MNVISRKVLKAFWKKYPDSEIPLIIWHKTVSKSEFQSFNNLRRMFGKKVDRVGQYYVFDIGGNKYRLIAAIHFDKQRIYIREVLTHAEYDKKNWKK